MASARLSDEVLALLGDFLDDAGLCALAGSERVSWERSCLQMQTRREQVHVILLTGTAFDREDCECAALQLAGPKVEPFVGECVWGGRYELYMRFHVEFCSTRSNLRLLRLAVEAWLGRLEKMSDMQSLRESLTFHDEYTGYGRQGAYDRTDIPRRVVDKLIPYSRRMRPWDNDFIVWGSAVGEGRQCRRDAVPEQRAARGA